MPYACPVARITLSQIISYNLNQKPKYINLPFYHQELKSRSCLKIPVQLTPAKGSFWVVKIGLGEERRGWLELQLAVNL